MLTLEGTQLGNYDVIRRIRVGGMGAVYEGRQRTAFGRRVAIKVILGSYASDREMRRRFAREARTIAQLHHPHILPLIEFGAEQGILYLVMPFIEGGTLTGYLRRELPELNDVADIFLQLLDAVEYAHEEGLIHRDIKSSNVLLDTRRSGPPYVYLADFGLVRYSEQADLKQAGKSIPLDQIPGTPHYMAPEQARGIVTTTTDIYALGVLLYQMLVGELPYDDPDDVEVVKMHLYAPVPSPCDRDASIPTELGDVVRKAMSKRAEERFASMEERVKQPLKRSTSQSLRRFSLAVTATTLIPLVLLLLLIMPRVLGFSFFPPGFPVLGTASIANIAITAQSKPLQDTYLLTASPQVTQPDLVTRVIPDRTLTATATDSRAVASTGTRSLPGTPASGTLLFNNRSPSTFTVPQGMVFTTITGVQVKLTQSVEVPPRYGGQDVTVTAPAQAVFPGVTGNISANALLTTCCNDQVTVSNPEPFTGGVDPQVVHSVSQADLDRVRNALYAQLQQLAGQQLQKKFAANEVEAVQPTYATKVVPDKSVGAQENQVRIQVSVSATVLVYNVAMARQVAEQLLSKQATILLDTPYHLKGSLVVNTPAVVQQGSNGLIYLSVSVRGLWIYMPSSQQLNAWLQSVKGATPTLAKAYLASQPGVAVVQIQLPFGMDHLPVSVERIKIVVVNG